MAAKTEDRPIPFSLAFFQRINQRMTEHYEAGAHEDRDGNTPCEDEYCKSNEHDVELLKAMFESFEPLLYKFIANFDFTEHESFDGLRDRVSRVAKHKHECGSRTTSGPLVVESA